MKDKLIDINEIMELLGYDDLRSVKTWCGKNKIPLFTVGRKTYTIANFLNIFLEKELDCLVMAHYQNPQEIMDAISNDDKLKLSDLIQAPVEQEVKKEYRKNVTRSKAAESFLKNIKTA